MIGYKSGYGLDSYENIIICIGMHAYIEWLEGEESKHGAGLLVTIVEWQKGSPAFYWA